MDGSSGWRVEHSGRDRDQEGGDLSEVSQGCQRTWSNGEKITGGRNIPWSTQSRTLVPKLLA